MIFEVELTMFQHGEIRLVDVPDSELNGDTEHDLGRIFVYGQNCVQALSDRVSVSAGDVIRFNGKRFLIMAIGYDELEADEELPSDQLDLLRRVYSIKDETKKT